MNNKFKIGDLVRYVGDSPYRFNGIFKGLAKKGDIFEISSVGDHSVGDHSYGVKGSYTGGTPNWNYMEENFELVTDPTDCIKNIKVRIKDESESRRVQEALCELGCEWNAGGGTIQHISVSYLYVSGNKSITYSDGNDDTYFNSVSDREVTPEYIIMLSEQQRISGEAPTMTFGEGTIKLGEIEASIESIKYKKTLEETKMELKDIKKENLKEAKKQFLEEKKNEEIRYAKEQYELAVNKIDTLDRTKKVFLEEDKEAREKYLEVIERFNKVK